MRKPGTGGEPVTRPGSVPVLLASVASVLLMSGSASAIPWDQTGALPPSETPPADSPDPTCSQSYANDPPRKGPRLEFGVGPRLAGEAGTTQTTPVVPENTRKRDAALLRLKDGRELTVRLNRLFESDGRAGIAEFKRMAHHYARLGMDVELQVRYHPLPELNGDIGAWLDYVRRVVKAFGPIQHVVGLQITNEVNLTISPNTSDGAYANAVEALARGVIVAKREARHLGFDQLQTGFNYAWRFGDTDADFWRAVGATGGRKLRRATDWVGIDAYPGTFIPAKVQDPGDALLEAIAQVRECYMPLAGLGPKTPIHLEEVGWPTGPGRDEVSQRAALISFVRTVNAYRGTYGVTGFNWFGLRDNNSQGPNFQSFFGLLRDDYAPKPAFTAYRRLIRRLGARPPR
jgi:hypothetical protein